MQAISPPGAKAANNPAALQLSLNAENAGRLEQPSSKVLVERSKVLLERSNARRDARPVEQPASAKDVEAFVEELRDALVDTKRVVMRHVAGLRGLGGSLSSPSSPKSLDRPRRHSQSPPILARHTTTVYTVTCTR